MSSASLIEPQRTAEGDEDADRDDSEDDCVLGHGLATVALGERVELWELRISSLPSVGAPSVRAACNWRQ